MEQNVTISFSLKTNMEDYRFNLLPKQPDSVFVSDMCIILSTRRSTPQIDYADFNAHKHTSTEVQEMRE